MISFRKADLLDKIKSFNKSMVDIYREEVGPGSWSVTMTYSDDETKDILLSIIREKLYEKWVVGRQETRVGLNNVWCYDQRSPINEASARQLAGGAVNALASLGYTNTIETHEVDPIDLMSPSRTIHSAHMEKDRDSISKDQSLKVGDRVKAQQWFIDALLQNQSVDFEGVEGVVTKAEKNGRVGVRWDGDQSDDIIESERIERV